MSRRVLFVRFDLGGMCTQYLFNRYCYWKGGRQMQRLSGGDERTEGGKVWGGFKKYSYKRGRLYKRRAGRRVLLGPTFGGNRLLHSSSPISHLGFYVIRILSNLSCLATCFGGSEPVFFGMLSL